MAPDQHKHPIQEPPHLGCWWRPWIAFSVFTTTGMLIGATYGEAGQGWAC